VSENAARNDVHEEVLPHGQQDESRVDDRHDLQPEQYFLLVFVELQHVDNQKAHHSTEKVRVDEVLPENERGKGLLGEAVLDCARLEQDLFYLLSYVD
jgi:hypothetical protein